MTTRTAWIAIATACLVFSHGLMAQEEKVELKDLPKAVADAVGKEFPGGTITEAQKELEGGKTVYEVKTKKDDKLWEVKLDENGKLISKEEDDGKDDDKDKDKGKDKEKHKKEKKPKKKNLK